MSEQNIELHRRSVEAFNARDIEALISYGDPGIEFHGLLAGAIGATVYHGHEGVRSWYRDLVEVWGDEIRIEPNAYFELGENTLLFAVLRGRGQHSSAEVAMPYAVVARWRDGLAVLFKTYVDRMEALRDLGVSEGELEPIAP